MNGTLVHASNHIIRPAAVTRETSETCLFQYGQNPVEIPQTRGVSDPIKTILSSPPRRTLYLVSWVFLFHKILRFRSRMKEEGGIHKDFIFFY